MSNVQPEARAAAVERVERLIAAYTDQVRTWSPSVPAPVWGPAAGERSGEYQEWLEDRGHETQEGSDGDPPLDGPLLMLFVQVDRTRPAFLSECLESIMGQSYTAWNLVIGGDAASDPAVQRTIAGFAGDPRVHTTAGDLFGPERDAVLGVPAGGHGDFVMMMSGEDVLASGALAQLARAAGSAEDVDIVYCDEDALDEAGHPCLPVFKPDWDPELLLAYPYLGSGTLYRRSLLDRIGISVPIARSAQYDLELRATEVARRIHHVPEPLYRTRNGTMGSDGLAAGADDVEGNRRRALEDAMARRSIDGIVEPGPRPGWFHIRRAVPPSLSVSVIIPFRDQASLTRACVDSLDRAAGYPIHEVVLVDNGSTEPETRVLRRMLEHRPRTRVIDVPGMFNWPAINNTAAAASTGDLLLFMNNDIEAPFDGWLRALIEHAQRPEVGAVGARLVYPDHSIQHVGLVLGIQGLAAHLLAGKPAGHPAYLGWDQVVRSWSAVTGACMLVRRQVFDELGGFDEGYPVSFNDVDFCLRLRDAGYRVVATPHAELVHFESVSRGFSGYGADVQRFLGRWERALRADDPFYNRNLSRNDPWCGLRAPGENEAWHALLDGLVPQPSAGGAHVAVESGGT